MERHDEELQRRVRDIIAVVTEDLDAVTFEVEDGVAYIEGVVPSERERRQISQAVSRIDGLRQVFTCLSTERILPAPRQHSSTQLMPTPVLMHYHSLS
ncbi:MAG: BON domain-containing protein [Chloroflexota bacterium]|nr:BON domain-containing protein [Chloroflexota bacterium]MDQ5866892.1 BON domain-containing protein [Chloroflexota bacterium]